MAGAAGPIPMGFGMENMQAEEENGFGSPMDEADAEPEMQAGDFDTMSDMGDGSVLEEMGMMPEDPLSESGDFADTADMDLEPGELSALDGEDLDAGMEEGYMETAFGSGDSVSAEMGDYPVGQEDLAAGDLKEPDMNLGGTVTGDGSVEDVGLGSGMDAFGRDGSLSGSGGFSRADASAGTQGILGEIGYETGMDGTSGFYSADGSMDPGNIHISGGEKEASAGGLAGQDFSKIGTGDTQIFPRVGGEEVNGIGYHDFDMPGQTDSATKTGADSRYTPSDANTGTGSRSFASDANAGAGSRHIPADTNGDTSRQNAATNPTGSRTMPMDSVPDRQMAEKNRNTDRKQPESDGRIQSSDAKKQEYRKITEERKFREVPKSRKELNKKRKKNPPQEAPDSQS